MSRMQRTVPSGFRGELVFSLVRVSLTHVSGWVFVVEVPRRRTHTLAARRDSSLTARSQQFG